MEEMINCNQSGHPFYYVACNNSIDMKEFAITLQLTKSPHRPWHPPALPSHWEVKSCKGYPVRFSIASLAILLTFNNNSVLVPGNNKYKLFPLCSYMLYVVYLWYYPKFNSEFMMMNFISHTWATIAFSRPIWRVS